MKIGYPCINWSMDCSGNKTFRLKSYSEERLLDTVENNLDCLEAMLIYNVDHDMLFFRITSELVPFASHEVNEFDWQSCFEDRFDEIGGLIDENHMRISMHPDQFIVLNSNKDDVVKRSIAELDYHADVLDLLNLDRTHKIQLHVGGVYGDKEKSKRRFVKRYNDLDEKIRERLVIENDDTSYTLSDCLEINEICGVPVLFDNFHHRVNNSGEELNEAMSLVSETWGEGNGIPMVDYSSQEKNEREGKHAETIDEEDFQKFISNSRPYDFDIMLEIKDKERSAKKAVKIIREDNRFFRG
ncbi:MAG: UV DNA damage repair endonuclease UvsE [Thermoplasmatota archaeon]